MYISKELFILIILAAFYILHLIAHIYELIKLHGIKTGKTLDLKTVKKKAKELLITMLDPQQSIISGLKKFIKNNIKSDNEEDSENNG